MEQFHLGVPSACCMEGEQPTWGMEEDLQGLGKPVERGGEREGAQEP